MADFEPEEFLEIVLTLACLVRLHRQKILKLIEYLEFSVSEEARKPKLISIGLLNQG